MTNETIILIGICCLILCLVLLGVAVFVFSRRLVKAVQDMWKKQKEALAAFDEAQELLMKFILEFAKVQLKSIEDLKPKVKASDDGQKEPAAIPKKTVKLTKGSQEAKDHMASIRPDGPAKGSQEAKDRMAAIRAKKEKKDA